MDADLMTARAAKFGDIPRVSAMLAQGAGRSKYSDLCRFDPKRAKQLLTVSIQRHGLHTDGGTCVFVSELEGEIDGVIVGVLDRVYHVFDKLSAGDLVLYVEPLGSPHSAAALIDAYFDWAEGIEGMVRVELGATDVIQDWDRVEALYRRKGMVQSGVIYERRIDT